MSMYCVYFVMPMRSEKRRSASPDGRMAGGLAQTVVCLVVFSLILYVPCTHVVSVENVGYVPYKQHYCTDMVGILS